MYTSSTAVRQRFVRDLEAKGFVFGDGVKPSERELDRIMVVNPDMTINYLNFGGRLLFGNMNRDQWRYTAKEPDGDTVVRVDYARFLSGAEKYFIMNKPRRKLFQWMRKTRR